MSLPKRSLGSSSSNQPNQPKKPCFDPIKQENSRLTADVPRAVRVERERAKSNSGKCCQSCTGNAPEEMLKQMRLMMGKFLEELRSGVLDRVASHLPENCQSYTRNSVEDVVQRMDSMENAFQELKEAFELANFHSPHLGRANARSTENNYARNLQLQLRTKLSLPLFTGRKLQGENGAPISVALIDVKTGDVVTSGPESSIELDVVVLEGDFNKEDGDNWAQEEFEKYMVKEREGKGPLLLGNHLVTLKGGVGELGELIITDNSSWNRSKSFRIGLKVATGYCRNTRIQEAKTEAFCVRDHRGEAYEKHYPPRCDDEVYRLDKIAKDGISHQKLKAAGIHKVKDFLLKLLTDSDNLKKILGSSIKTKSWDILVRHTKTCKTNWKFYLYCPDGMRMHGAIFTIDGQLISLIEDGVHSAAHELSAQKKECGDKIVEKAFRNPNDIREFNAETFSDIIQKKCSSPLPSQVFEGQIENLIPVQCNLAPRICEAPVGPEAPPANVGSTAEGHNGATALPLPVQPQNTNCEAAMDFPLDESAPLAASGPLPGPEGNLVMEDTRSKVGYDMWEYLLETHPMSDTMSDTFFDPHHGSDRQRQ